MSSNISTGIEKSRAVQTHNGNLLSYKPKVDIFETGDSMQLLVEMPGVSRDNLEVSSENGILTIRGKKVSDIPGKEFLLRETSDVMYERFFELTRNLDVENIQATYQAGILKISIPKQAVARSRKIEIQ